MLKPILIIFRMKQIKSNFLKKKKKKKKKNKKKKKKKKKKLTIK